MQSEETFTWLNGQQQATISVFDRGLAFGDGLFETLWIHRGKAPLLAFHLERLFHDAARLGIVLDKRQVEDDINTALALVQQQERLTWRLKYLITRGQSVSGYTATPHSVANRVMHLLPQDAGLVRLLQQQGVKTSTCHWRLSEQPRLAGIKHLNRLDQVLARQELLDSDCYEGLLCDQSGNYVEGTMSNLFAFAPSGELVTPELDVAGVDGVMRRLIMKVLAPSIKQPCYEAQIHRMSDFVEVFICNAVIGIIPVISIDKQAFAIGPVTRELQKQLQNYLKKA